MEKIEHVLKKWEKKYGYLGLTPKELKLFSAVRDKRFTLRVLGKELYERKIDGQKRIWISHGALNDLEEGDILILGQNEKGNYYIEKKK